MLLIVGIALGLAVLIGMAIYSERKAVEHIERTNHGEREDEDRDRR